MRDGIGSKIKIKAFIAQGSKQLRWKLKLFPLKNPSPDFESFKEVLLGKKEPEKVHFVELLVDFEVMSLIAEKLMKQKIPSISHIQEEKKNQFIEGKDISALTEEEKPYLKGVISFYHHMGYDYVPVWVPLAPFPVKMRVTDDTAMLSRGKRTWVEEKEGIITSWEDFESFPWDRVRLDTEDFFNFLSENLPEGMKITVTSTLYEMVGERLLGWEGMFRKLYLEPDLVKAVFDRWGEIIYDGYKEAVSFDCVGAIFHGDDLGYKKGTMIKPDTLREILLPWFKRYTSLAHQHKKMYWYHSCGNIYQIMEDLIEDVKIDAFHSFQDVIVPVWEFKKKYGDRVAALGGVDVDKLARYEEEPLRKYVRDILDRCLPGGRYALGSGNSVTNYVPPRNYLIMLEEGAKWKPEI